MNTGKILVLAAFAGAIVALFTTEKGKKIREELQDAAGDWSDQLSELAEKASCYVKDLLKLLGKEVSVLTEDARALITAIIEESIKSGRKAKRAAENAFA
jgi:hypothetical protein